MNTAIRSGAAIAASLLVTLGSVAGGAVASAAAPPLPRATSPSNSTSYKPSGSQFSLTISPTRLVIGAHGISGKHQILVVNRGSSPVPVTVQKRNFTGNKDGSLEFQLQAPYSASDWMTLQTTSFVLAPGASRNIWATINVPAHPEPGDHQVAIVFLVPAGKTAANIRINRGVATPVYITVPGPVDNTVVPRNLDGPGFATGGTVNLTAQVHDTGTVHRDFRGKTQLKVAASGAGQAFPDFTVLRGSTRDIATKWDPPLMCICHPKVSITSADGTVHSTTVRVIVFPLPQLGILLGALVLIGFVIFFLRRRYRASVASAAAALQTPGSSGDG